MPACELVKTRRPASTEYHFFRKRIEMQLAVMLLLATAAGWLTGSLTAHVIKSAWAVVVATCIGFMITAWLIILQITDTETLIVHHDLGVVLQRRNVLGCLTHNQFLDKDSVQGVFINEVLGTHAVHCLLTFMVRGQEDLVVAFQALEPKLSQIVPIYQDLLALGWGVVHPAYQEALERSAERQKQRRV